MYIKIKELISKGFSKAHISRELGISRKTLYQSVAFLAKKIGGRLKAGSDAKEVATFHHFPAELAFDHSKILVAADLDRDHD